MARVVEGVGRRARWQSFPPRSGFVQVEISAISPAINYQFQHKSLRGFSLQRKPKRRRRILRFWTRPAVNATPWYPCWQLSWRAPTFWHQWTAGGPFRLLWSISRANDTKLGSNGIFRSLTQPGLFAMMNACQGNGSMLVEGEIETPAGRSVVIRTVWIVDHGQSSPRLVMAYPLVPEKDDD